ncbi:hypothetical protein TNCV_2732291 [Trichonephila clavipes]|nr:hypothetical protein TNCV_2732291 [Trichonephila clavipes]
MVLLPEEVGEKGFLESRSPTFRIDSSRKGHVCPVNKLYIFISLARLCLFVLNTSQSISWKKVNAIQTRSQWKKEAEKNRTSEAVEKEEMKLEENLAEDIENLLSSITEEKDTMSLINIYTDGFIKAQQKSEELSPLI